MAWSLEEKLLVVGCQDGIVAVWDMGEQQVIHILTGHTGEARKVGFVDLVIKMNKISGRLGGSVH